MSDWDALRIHVARLRNRHDAGDFRKRPHAANAIEVDTEVEASGLAISTARIPDGSPVRITGRVEAGSEDLDAHLHVRTRWMGECRRCLEVIEEPFEISIRAAFSQPNPGQVVDGADTYPIDGDWIDLGAVVREEVLLALPLAPLCSDDCVGPDPERFAPTTEPHPGGGVDEPVVDPRWAALSELQFDED